MVINVPIKEQRFLRDERAVFATNLYKYFPLVKEAPANREQITAQVKQISRIKIWQVRYDRLFGFIQLSFESFNRQIFLINDVIQDDVQKEGRSLQDIFGIEFYSSFNALE